MKLRTIAEQVLKEAEDESQIKAMDAAFAASFKTLGSEFKSHESEIKQDVEDADIKLNESLTVATVIGLLLAAPKVIELLTKAFDGVVKFFRRTFNIKGAKTKEEQSELAAKILEGCHRWHEGYIKGIKWILKISGLFKKAGIESDADQKKAAELVYYVIIAALAVYSGIGAAHSFKHAIVHGADAGNISLGTLELAMANLKTAEVASFIGELGLKSA